MVFQFNSADDFTVGQKIQFCGSRFQVVDVLDQNSESVVLQVKKTGSGVNSIISISQKEKFKAWWPTK